MCEICREVGGPGVAVGHSGTAPGVLLDAADPACPRRATDAAQACTEPAGGVAVYRTLSFPNVPLTGPSSAGTGVAGGRLGIGTGS
ncbi:hypothetical protein [Streptomyces marianii]|uniref:hypothetical protein n=1 Tax=Streptomyces marianii TaxID=1817406 RepID=UPI001F47A07E|nr:hypothetical protein [Streptomyces marianii]